MAAPGARRARRTTRRGLLARRCGPSSPPRRRCDGAGVAPRRRRAALPAGLRPRWTPKVRRVRSPWGYCRCLHKRDGGGPTSLICACLLILYIFLGTLHVQLVPMMIFFSIFSRRPAPPLCTAFHACPTEEEEAGESAVSARARRGMPEGIPRWLSDGATGAEGGDPVEGATRATPPESNEGHARSRSQRRMEQWSFF